MIDGGVIDNSDIIEALLSCRHYPNPAYSPEWWSSVPVIDFPIGRFRITRPIRIKSTAWLLLLGAAVTISHG